MPHSAFAGSRCLVTGASGGIGRALAIALAQQGAQLVVTARRAAELQETVRRIAQYPPGQAWPVVGDLTEAAVRAEAIETANRQLGGLDYLVNNAGVGALGPFADASAERLRQVMEVNFFAQVELTRLALPLLRGGRQALVVNISSILARRGVPLSSEYCASKAAVETFSQSLRAELAPWRIGVLVVSPGSTETDFFDHVLERGSGPSWRSRRGLTPEQVARATLRGMRRRAHRVVPGLVPKAIDWLNRLWPSLLDRVVALREPASDEKPAGDD